MSGKSVIEIIYNSKKINLLFYELSKLLKIFIYILYYKVYIIF